MITALAAAPLLIHDKTLVAWVSPATFDQKGGSALTLEKPGGVFDGIVFGELTPATWMAGSDSFRRTQQNQKGFPHQTDSGLVQIGITYKGNQIALYRDGRLAVSYTTTNQESFGDDSWALIGLRHIDATPQNRFFQGSISEARIYDSALDPAEMASLKPHIADKQPLGWWDFADGSAMDRMKTFGASTLVGDARIKDGKLILGQEGGYLMATRKSVARQDPNSVTRQLREKLLADPYRPGYHFAIPEGVAMPFDPNGAIYWKGQYHLFYIFQDERGHNFGHISSTDLFHWRQHPVGLTNGMFSGNCFINKEGVPTMCYHQVDQGNAMAVALDDDLDTWKKLDSNPITPKTGAKPGYRSWDPDAWIEDGHYYAIFGGEHPAVVKSETLEGPWNYVGDLMANSVPGVSLNEDVSCADFFKIGNKRMLLCISHRLGCRYYLGDWKNEQFHPTFQERMSWVDHTFFAPESLLDDKGRRIMWSWMMDRPGFGTKTDQGWSGTMSLPRVLTLASDGTLHMNPPQEIERLRYNPQSKSAFDVPSDGSVDLDKIGGNSIELNLTINAKDAAQYGVSVCRSKNGDEETLVYYDAVEKRLKVDTTKQGVDAVESAPFSLNPGEPLKLRIFVDKSVVEVFANDGRQAIGRHIYPSRADSLGVRVFAKGGSARVSKVQKWDMMPSNPY